MDIRQLVTGAAVLLLAFAAFATCGCNTVEGAGEDVEAVGEGVQDAAD